MIANKVYESSNTFGAPEWRKIGYDDTYEDAQLLHQCMTKRLKREDDPDYDPDLSMDGDSSRPSSGGGMSENFFYFLTPLGDTLKPPGTCKAQILIMNVPGTYFQKPIFQCPECVRSYKSPVRMANHYRDKHPEKDLRSPYARYPTSQVSLVLALYKTKMTTHMFIL
jgi:hypothetical protein